MDVYNKNYSVLGEDRNIEMITPNALIFSQSRNVVTCKLMNGERTMALSGVKLQIVLVSTDGKFFFTNEFKYTDSNGYCLFDISKYIQAMAPKIDDLEDMGAVYENVNRKIPGRRIIIEVYDGGTPAIISGLRTIYNGRLRIPESFWIKPLRLKWFRNYPFTIDYPDVNEVTLSKDGSRTLQVSFPQLDKSLFSMQRLNISRWKETRDAERLIYMYTSGNAGGFAIERGYVVLDTTEGNYFEKFNEVQIEIDDTPLDRRYCYIRWLGRYGQVFYWLFEKKEHRINIENEYIERASQYNEMGVHNFKGDYKQNKKIDNRILVASSYLDNEHYNLIISILESPSVYMYLDDTLDAYYGDNSNIHWQQVYVAGNSHNVSFDIRNKGKRHQLVLELTRGEEMVSC